MEKANKRYALVKQLRQVPVSWKSSVGLRALDMARLQSLKLALKQVTRIGALNPCLPLPALLQKTHEEGSGSWNQ